MNSIKTYPMTVMTTLCLLLAAAPVSASIVVYLNTFDSTGNQNIGSDSTSAAGLFDTVQAILGSSPNTVTEEAFGGGDSNGPGSAASGNYANFAAGDNNQTRFATAPTTVVSGEFQSIVDHINTFSAGIHEITFEFDYAGTHDRLNFSPILFGDFTNTDGRYIPGSTGLSPTGSLDDFEHFTGTVSFELVDSGADPTSGIFTVGDFQGLNLGFGIDNRSPSTGVTQELNVDNFSVKAGVIPEPGTLAMIGVGAALLAVIRRTHSRI